MFVLFLVLLVTLVLFSVAKRPIYRYYGEEKVYWPRIVNIVLVILLVITGGIASTVIVSTKNVGVTTEFGRPVGTLENGLHFKLPWQSVTELDGAIQTDTHKGDGSEPDVRGPASEIRIGNQSIAKVDNSIRWRIRPDRADELFRDYRDFDNIRESLVTRELNAALNEVFSSYDPLTPTGDREVGSPDLDEFGEQVTLRLQERIGDQIEVINVIIPLVRFDDSTQSRINAYQAEIGNTRVAEQKQQTAEAEAKANQMLAQSVSNDPNVLVSKCLDTLADMVEAEQQVPAGFSCWPGGGSALVVPSGN